MNYRMYPLMILIAIGTLFFIMGFLALFRIRREIKRSSTVTSTGSDKVFTSGGQRSLLWDQSHEISNNVIRAGAARLEILMVSYVSYFYVQTFITLAGSYQIIYVNLLFVCFRLVLEYFQSYTPFQQLSSSFHCCIYPHLCQVEGSCCQFSQMDLSEETTKLCLSCI